MGKSRFGIAMMALSLVLAGCAAQPGKQEIGTVAGGATGALIGSQFGGGKGRVVGAAVGGVAGALAGSQIGKSMDMQDRAEQERRAREERQRRYYEANRYGYY